MNKPARRSKSSRGARAPTPLATAPEPETRDRSQAVLLGATAALLVATALIPSEAAVPNGSHVILVMGWLLVTLAWLVRRWLAPAHTARLGWPEGLLLLFLLVHSVSALIMIRYGHGRPTLNALWVWLSLGATFFAVRQLARTRCQQRAVVSVLIALTVGIATYGIYQTWVIYPANRALYRLDPEAALRQAGESAPVGSPQRKHFEDRLASTEPTGTFALANSLAGLLVPMAVLMLAVARPVARSWPGQTRLVGWMGALAALAVVLTCLVLTKSRSGYLALLVGAVLLAVSRAVPRNWLRGRILFGGAIVVLVLIGLAVQFGGLDRQVLTEAPKSLLYRLQYWQASMGMIREHPLWGCGPGNFKEYYTHYKLPEASESIADPHNFLVEVAATAGLPAATLLVLSAVGMTLFVWRRIGRGQQQEPGEPMAEPWAVYAGAGAGLVLAYPAGLAGSHPPDFGLLWTLLPAAVVMLLVLRPWVARGELPAGPLLIACAALLVNLLAAGGISFPGVAQVLWCCAALAMNAAWGPGDGAEESAELASRAGRLAAAGAMLAVLALIGAAFVTFYRPLLTSSNLLNSVREKGPVRLSQVVPVARAAAQADPWWCEPCQVWADAEHQQWIAQPTPAALAEFDTALAAAQQRNSQSFVVAQLAGDWLLEMYLASGNRTLLERSVEAYQRAVTLYPASNLLHAQLAWTCFLAGQRARAAELAQQALELDEQIPHQELKLRGQVLVGAGMSGEGAPHAGGRDAEQMMELIRTRRDVPGLGTL